MTVNKMRHQNENIHMSMGYYYNVNLIRSALPELEMLRCENIVDHSLQCIIHKCITCTLSTDRSGCFCHDSYLGFRFNVDIRHPHRPSNSELATETMKKHCSKSR